MTDLHWTSEQCCCSGCLESLGAIAASVDYTLDPSNTLAEQSDIDTDLPIWSAYQTAQHIARGGSSFADDMNDPGDITEVTYHFLTAETLEDPNHAFEGVNQAHTRDILDQYAEIGNIQFTEVTSPSEPVDISFRYRDGSNGGGYWDGSNVVVSRVGWEPEMDYGTYNRRLMLHEVGHAMGLSHPGSYNGGGSSYETAADHWNDSNQYSNMSYWGESNTGGSFGNMSTLGLHDILAIQIEYGINTSTRTGDDIYGFNATAGDAYDFTSTRTNGRDEEITNTNMAFSIWDADGHDTIDFSGSSKGTELDLRAGSFSSTNGQTFNVSIAYGAVIEDGVGSDHADLIQGNQAVNTLFGGTGDDTLIGGSFDLEVVDDTRFFTGISLNEDPNIFDQHLQVDDFNGFSNGIIDIDMLVSITRMSSRSTSIVSYATLSDSNMFLIDALGNGLIRIYIDGEYVETDIQTITLVDGEAHRVGVTWDSTSGALTFHVDGDLLWQGVLQQGAVIPSGGTLVFGQDQDSLGGGFNNRETFQGAIGDIRIFDTLRNDETITSDAFSAPLNKPIHHWVPQVDTDTRIADTGEGGLVDLIAANRDNVTATSSSQYASYEAGLIVDGDVDTFGHTQNGTDEYLSVRFKTAIRGERIEIHNRSSNGQRLDEAEVSIFDPDGVLIQIFDPISSGSWRSVHQFDLPADVLIGEIRLSHENQFIHISEIKVLAQKDGATRDLEIFNGAQTTSIGERGLNVVDSDTLHGGDGNDMLIGAYGDDLLNGGDGHDILFGGVGTFIDLIAADPDNVNVVLSSQYQSFGAELILDGDQDTFAHTENGDAEFISVRFERAISGDVIEIRNRDGVADRLNGAEVSIFDPSGTLIQTFDPIADATQSSGHQFELPDDVLIAEIRISHSGQFLHIAGIKVLTERDRVETEIDATRVSAELLSDNDELSGGVGNDRLFGGDGADNLNGGAGHDTLRGDAGDDTFLGGDGMDVAMFKGSIDTTVRLDTVNAQNTGHGFDHLIEIENMVTDGGNDHLTGNDFDNQLSAGAGDDTLVGGGGADRLDGGAGTDVADYRAATARVNLDLSAQGTAGEAAGDTFTSVENVLGSSFDDFISGDTGSNLLDGGNGADRLRGGGGNDTLIGGGGADDLKGGAGIDVADYSAATTRVNLDLRATGTGGEAAGDTFSSIETVVGSAFNDFIYGDTFGNILDGGKGTDRLRGDAGNDTLIGGSGADQLVGGSGTDVASYETALTRVNLDLRAQGTAGDAAGDTYTSIENILGSDFDDYFYGTADANVLEGGRGADRLLGDSGDDTLMGGEGSDSLLGGMGADRLEGGAGIDLANYASAYSRVNLDLRAQGTGGEAAGDTFSSVENVRGSAFGDYIYGESGDNLLEGRGGNDRLRGDGGADTLIGGAGEDHLIGGSGDDVLFGGAGVDEFVFYDGSESDVIKDFQNNVDTIRLLEYGFVDVASALASASEADDNVIFDLGGSDVLIVESISLNQLANDLEVA